MRGWRRWLPLLALLPAVVGGQAPAGVIVFAADTGRETGIFLIRPNGTGLQQVVASGRDPAFTAGGHIVFVRENDLYLVDRTGENLTRLSQRGEDGGIGNPAASADGAIILFNASTTNLAGSIRLYHTDGSGERALTPGMDPSFTPDAVRIVFACNGGIYGMARPAMIGISYAPVLVWQPETPLFIRYPVVGPGDFRGLVFAAAPVAVPEASWSLMVLRDTARGPRLSTLAANASQPAFSPDGRHLAFVRDGCLYYMRADGTQPVCLLQGIGAISHPDWGRE